MSQGVIVILRIVQLLKGHIVLLSMLLYTVPCSVVVNAQVVKTDRGEVEFIGLKSWTIDMIKDSLTVHAPNGAGLWGCAVDLKSKLRFADASVVRHRDGSSLFTVITVVEPQNQGRIQYRQQPPGAHHLLQEYAVSGAMVEQDDLYMTFQIVLLNYNLFLEGKRDSLSTILNQYDGDANAANMLWDFLSSKTSDSDKLLAVNTLQQNSNPANRMIAAAILGNFANDDESWNRLLGALCDYNAKVRTAARLTLLQMIEFSPRPVNWSPSVATLRSLLSGTNLFAYTTVLKTLARTEVSPSLSEALLDETTSDLLFSYLRASRQEERELAHDVLARLTNKDFGLNVDQWNRWILKAD